MRGLEIYYAKNGKQILLCLGCSFTNESREGSEERRVCEEVLFNQPKI